jgi:hypothetical protein
MEKLAFFGLAVSFAFFPTLGAAQQLLSYYKL